MKNKNLKINLSLIAPQKLLEYLGKVKGAITTNCISEVILPTENGIISFKINSKTDKYGTQRYYNSDNQLHRDNDQPAIISADGSQYWYKNGQLHRDNDLPAIIYADGTKLWYRNGQLHRDNDQPAEISADGSQYWYKNGQIYTPVEITNKNPEKDFNKIKEILSESN